MHVGDIVSREQEIRSLRVRYLVAVSERKNKTASIIYARLSSLMARQLKTENRQDRKIA